MGKFVRTLTITYDLDIENWEVPLFRGAVVDAIGSSVNMLFHNHTPDDGLRYSYPLIQYKRQGGKACIVAVEQGADIIGQFMASGCNMLKIGEREATCDVAQLRPRRVLVQLWQSPFHYSVSKWLPLNGKNYEVYMATEDAEERKALLEGILKGNLLAMLKGLDIWLDGNLTVQITNLSEPYKLRYKGVDLMAFNTDFDANLSIPANVGIGRHVSVGFGTIRLQRKGESDNVTTTENNNP